MKEYIISHKSNCKNCYKCIRNCPVKSIRFSGNQANIIESECIFCGQCYTVCPQNAKEIHTELENVKIALAENEMVIASIAPSFAAYYPTVTMASMNQVLKKLGFSFGEETALGATLVKKEYEELVAEGKQNIIISSCCHSINLLLQKYYPHILPYLAKVVSPMQAHCTSIKNTYPNAKTVFIGPCISKKGEADAEEGITDFVLLFNELDQWMAEENIIFEPMDDLPETKDNSRARFFPSSGGILKTMEKENSDYTYLSVDGMDNCINAIHDIETGNLSNCFIEMSACAGSCAGGPLMLAKKNTSIHNYIAIHQYAGKKDFIVDRLDKQLMTKEHHFLGTRKEKPGSTKITQILEMMGKIRPEDELNCGSCGYSTCRDKAMAVYNGNANYAMCLPFLKDKAESFSDNIIRNTPNGIMVLNKSLEVEQINEAALRIMNIQKESYVLGESVVRILDPSIFFDVLETGMDVHNKLVYLTEYEKYVEQTVVYDKSYHLLICIMRDVTKEEKAREKKEILSRKTIETANQVVEKQMRVVQEIASLLGETTADTSIALTRLKELFRDE